MVGNHTDSVNPLNYRRSKSKESQASVMFVDFFKSDDSIDRGKTEQILLAYGFLNETVSAIMMLYKNTKSVVCSSEGDIDCFGVARVLQEVTLALYISF